VRRVVRRIDVLSVLKVSSLLFVTVTLVLLVAGVILWFAGTVLGAVEGVERFMSVLGFDDFRFVGPQLLRGFVAAGLVVVLAGTGSCVFMATVYNLIADVVGGVQFVVLEEDLRRRPAAAPPAGPAVGAQRAGKKAGRNGSAESPAAPGSHGERPARQPLS
jgi:hypothetical protein